MTSTFRQQLAEPRTFPGGGSAAAYVGDVALVLVEKVVRLEMKRSEVDTKTAVIWNCRLSRTADLSTQFQFLIQEDGRAYGRMSSMRSRVTEVEIAGAVREAAMVPLQIILGAIQGLSLIAESARECKKYLVPDLQVSCELLWAVVRGGEAIVTANAGLMESTNRTESLTKLSEAVEEARDEYTKTKAALKAALDRAEKGIRR